jgi:hypothetical protein
MDSSAVPGHPNLCVDLWQHTYYFKYQNSRRIFPGSLAAGKLGPYCKTILKLKKEKMQNYHETPESLSK